MNRHNITGGATLAGIVGQPVAHSLSPAIHNAWLAEAEIDGAYVGFGPADEAAFYVLFAAGKAGLIRGFNVTAPFKGQALALADTATDTARLCGSANTVVFENGKAHADSFDGQGLMEALHEQAPALSVVGKPVVVLGAGGAARAGAAALSTAGAEVRILNRTSERAEILAAHLGDLVTVADGPEEAFPGAVLVVNALSAPPAFDMDFLPPGIVLMDMSYKPVITPFLAAGRARGLTVVDGLAMLVGQARPSFEALFGQAPPKLDVRAVALNSLRKRGEA
ncbi:MAG TPA: shikimate dehydrogenase [Brevundimonas sp.]